MQRIFKYGDIQNISLNSDKEPNILIYWTTSYVIIHRTYALLKMVHFLAHPVHACTYVVCVTSEITLMVLMSGTACSTLTFDNCVSCTDASPATSKAQCTKCGSGYTLKDDNSSCTSMFLWIFETFNQNTIWQSRYGMSANLLTLNSKPEFRLIGHSKQPVKTNICSLVTIHCAHNFVSK